MATTVRAGSAGGRRPSRGRRASAAGATSLPWYDRIVIAAVAIGTAIVTMTIVLS